MRSRRFAVAAVLVVALGAATAAGLARTGAASQHAADRAAQFPVVKLPPGLSIEKVVGGLTYPTSITWDDAGRMYVAEAGGQFLEEPPPARILRIQGGRATEAINLTRGGVADSAAGMTFFKGAFYVVARDPKDRSGAVFRATPGGSVTKILT
ncbi:MAG: sugar dehydrogenase, partial [Actinobacteria bacterium]|nr:sugar dehydrogenase [Actinomycetota bacterium]